MHFPVALASESPRVSIVITTFNHARFLGEAIGSALVQTIPASEIIVVDDGSTDHPETVAACFPSVRFVRQSNQGPSAARNAGLKLCAGEYVVFLDADDRLLPEALEVNLESFRSRPECGYVYAAHCKMNATGEHRWPIPLKEIGGDAYATMLEGNSIGMHATVMYRRDRLQAVGGFDNSIFACEDYDVFLRMARLYPVVCCPVCIAEYRQHDANSSRNSPMMLQGALRVLGRQRAHARSRPDWRAAYERGVLGWKQYYVSEQVAKAMHDPSSRAEKLRHTASMLCIAPLVTRRIALRMWREHRRNAS